MSDAVTLKRGRVDTVKQYPRAVRYPVLHLREEPAPVYFEVLARLLSRSRVFPYKEL